MVTLDHGRFGLSSMRIIGIIFLTIALSILQSPTIWNSVSSSNSDGPRLPIQASPSQSATKVSITPPLITGSPDGSQIVFGVNMSKTASMTSTWITMQYDNTILFASSIDYTTGIFGQYSGFKLEQECINLQGQLCSLEPAFAKPSDVSWRVSLNDFLINPSGLLFNVNFKVIGVGFSSIHIVQSQIINFTQPITTVNSDGFFSNKPCGSAICRPLTVNLNYTRVPVPVVGRVVKFNATVVNPNNDAIQWYQWEWGDRPTVGNTTLLTRVNYANHTYLAADNSYHVTLIVNDTFGITGIATISLAVGRVWIQLGIGSLDANPRSQVIPGTRVNVTVQMQNLSTTNQSAQVSVLVNRGILGNQTLLTKTCSLLRPSGSCSSSTVLDTSNLTARVYELTANAQLTVTNSTLFQNDTSASSRIIFLWLVTALPNAGLSIAQGSLIGIGGIVVAYAAFLLVRRITRGNTEF
ncbi:MAG TPA: PKD domain-containing protein [Candidatus Angelobacter sp.]|nr:PKD domain-containing protein [Candidatus Angelobacter sp.]